MAADPKDDAPPPRSAIADVFSSVENWSRDTFGALGDALPRPRAAENPFARDPVDPLAMTGWSQLGAALVDQAATRTAPPPAPVEPPPSFMDLYSAHEKSYDESGGSQHFIDPSSFVLAMRGAPPLEAVKANPGSISGAGSSAGSSTGFTAGSSAGSSAGSATQRNSPLFDKSAIAHAHPPAPVAAVSSALSTDAISSGAASLYAPANKQSQSAEAKATADAWHKLWHH